MWKVILQTVKAAFPIAAMFSTLIQTAASQQNVVADKNDTHPEVSAQQYVPARITIFAASAWSGYNEITWSAIGEQDTRRYIVEFSYDGRNFQTAGEQAVTTGTYLLKHYTNRNTSLLYRIRIEKKDDRFINTAAFLLEGDNQAPVKVFPTFVEGNTINIKMDMPVETIRVISSSGHLH